MSFLHRLSLAALAMFIALCSAAPGWAAGPSHGRSMVPPPAPRIIIGKRDGLHAQMIKKFDKNGDGRLDEAEKAAAKTAAANNPKVNGKK